MYHLYQSLLSKQIFYQKHGFLSVPQACTSLQQRRGMFQNIVTRIYLGVLVDKIMQQRNMN
jgi:hypothetical protein